MQRRNHTPPSLRKIKSPSTVLAVPRQRGGANALPATIGAIGHLAHVADRAPVPTDRDMPEEGRYASGRA